MKNNKICFCKIRNVKSPKRNYGDAGNDFFVPEYSEQFVKDLNEKNKNNDYTFIYEGENIIGIKLHGHSQILIPSGIKVYIYDPMTYLDAENKSGIATKKGLLVGAQVVDASYRGEVHINVHNVSNKSTDIMFGDKLVQFIHKEYRETQWEEINADEYETLANLDLQHGMVRGEGGFGSTTLK